MNDRIRMEWEQMEDVAAQLKRLSDVLHSVNSRIRGVRIDSASGANVRISLSGGRLSSTGTALKSGTAEECLEGLAAASAAMNEYAQRLAGNIEKAAELFATNEMQLVRDFGGMLTPEEIMRHIAQIMGYDPDPETWSPQTRDDIQEQMKHYQAIRDEDVVMLVKDGEVNILGPGGPIVKFDWSQGLSGFEITSELLTDGQRLKGELDIGLIDGGFSYKGDLLERGDLFRDQGIYDPQTGKTTESPLAAGVGIGLFSIGAQASASYSAISETVSGQRGNLSGELTAGVGNLSASASAVGGLGLYVGPDGKTQVQAGFKAEAGASVSAANVKASMAYELCDNVSIGLEGEVSVAEAEAKVGSGIGVVDGEVMAYVEASAEANLVEASAEADLDLGLVEGKVGASVSVGIGAHAKAGYKDGVISFDIGASIGVGASISAELDISGAVDAIGNAAQAVSESWDRFCDWISW